jgi:hypothetical protein
LTSIIVLRPDRHGDSAESGPTTPLAPREALAEDAILTLIDNGKTHARPVLELIGEELRRRLPQIGTIEFVAKSSAGKTISDEVAARIAERSALAVAALGDCGACSSCSALDAVTLERHGVPSAVVITEPFVGLVERFSAMAGMPGYPPVLLPHPIASRSDEELRALVAGIADQLVAQLTAAQREPTLVAAGS